MRKFKVGDKVRILPSATIIGVDEGEVGKVVKITKIYDPNDIMISDSRGRERGCWCVNHYNITPAIKKGQQLLFSFMSEE